MAQDAARAIANNNNAAQSTSESANTPANTAPGPASVSSSSFEELIKILEDDATREELLQQLRKVEAGAPTGQNGETAEAGAAEEASSGQSQTESADEAAIEALELSQRELQVLYCSYYS